MASVVRNRVAMLPNAPRLLAAAASSAEVQLPIAARMIGTSIPSRSHRGVFSMAFSPDEAGLGLRQRLAGGFEELGGPLAWRPSRPGPARRKSGQARLADPSGRHPWWR